MLLIVFGGIFALFWYNEWVYSLPTPIPQDYVEVKPGTAIVLPARLLALNNKPVFIHFFNPSCPCSRFNIPHFQSLVKAYEGRVNFAAVVLHKKSYTEEEVRRKLGVDIPIIFDAGLATSCGVYSTPQAVLINTDHKLYYRGNYNKSRYCNDKNSNYAQMAIDSLLRKRFDVKFNPLALKAYGCELPTCKK